MILNIWRRWVSRLLTKTPRLRRTRRARRLGVELLEDRLVPTTDTWMGTVSSAWSTAGNWSNGLPTTGETVVFGPQATNRTVTVNNLTSIPALAQINISASGYNISGGDAIEVTGSITVNQGVGNEIIATQNLELAPPPTAPQFNIAVNSASTLTVTCPIVAVTGTTVSKTEPGTLVLSGNSAATWAGAFTLANSGGASGGVVQVTVNGALGTTLVTVNTNTQLQLDPSSGSLSYSNSLLLNGSGLVGDGGLLNETGANTWTGSIQMDSDSTFGVDAGTLTVSGQISDNGAGHNLFKVGAGTLVFPSANTYRGQTTVSNGILEIENPLSLGAGANELDTLQSGQPSSETIVTDNPTDDEYGTLELNFSPQFVTSTDPNALFNGSGVLAGFQVFNDILVLNGPGYDSATGRLGALYNASGDNEWDGSVILGGLAPATADPTIDTNSGSELVVSGVVSDTNQASSVTKTGTGTLVFNDANTYRGDPLQPYATFVDQGILDVADSTALGASTAAVDVESGASLQLDVDSGFDGTAQRTHGRNLAFDSVNGSGLNQLTGQILEVTGNSPTTFQLSIGANSTLIPLNTTDPGLTGANGEIATDVDSLLTEAGYTGVSVSNVTGTTISGTTYYNITYSEVFQVASPSIAASVVSGTDSLTVVNQYQVGQELDVIGASGSFTLSTGGQTSPAITVSDPNLTGSGGEIAIAIDNLLVAAGLTDESVSTVTQDGDLYRVLIAGPQNDVALLTTSNPSLVAVNPIEGLTIANPITLNGSGFQATPTSTAIGALDSHTGINIWTGSIFLEPFSSASIGVDADVPPSATLPTLGLDELYVNRAGHPTADNNYLQWDYSLTVTGTITGGDLTKTGEGGLYLPSHNDYGDTTSVNAPTTDIALGWITIGSDDSLGPNFDPAQTNTPQTLEPYVQVQAGGSLQIDPQPGTSLTMYYNFLIAGLGLTSQTYGLIEQSGAIENINGDNTLAGIIQLDETQVVTVPSGAGNFTLTYGGKSTGSLQLSDPNLAADMEADLDSLTNIGLAGASVQVTKQTTTSAGTVYDVTFLGSLIGTNAPITATGGGVTVANENAGIGVEQIPTTIPNPPNDGFPPLLASSPPLTASQLTLTGYLWNYTPTSAGALEAGGLTKLGSRRLIIEGSGTYTGGVTVQNGVLLAQNSTALGAGTATSPAAFPTVSVISGASLEFGNTVNDENVGNGIINEDGGVQSGIEVDGENLILNGAGDPAFNDSALSALAGNTYADSPTVQTVTVTGLTTGSYVLSFNGASTGAIPANASAALVQGDLNALSTIGGSGGSVEVAQTGNVYTVTFGGSLLTTSLSLVSVALTGTTGALAYTGAFAVITDVETGVASTTAVLSPVNDPIVATDDLWRGPVTLASNTTITADTNPALPADQNASRLIFTGSIGDDYSTTGSPSSLTILGGGEVDLDGADTYSGLTYVQQGVLSVGNSQALGTGSIAATQLLSLNGLGLSGNSGTYMLSFNGYNVPGVSDTPTSTSLSYYGDSTTTELQEDASAIQNTLQGLMNTSGGETDSAALVSVNPLSDPIIGASESGTTVTITTMAPLTGLVANQSYVTISGITPTGFDGTFEVTGVSGNTFTFTDASSGLTGASVSSATATEDGVFTVGFGGAASGFPVNPISVTAASTTVSANTITAGNGGTVVENGASLEIAGAFTVAGKPLLLEGNGTTQAVQQISIPPGTSGDFYLTFTGADSSGNVSARTTGELSTASPTLASDIQNALNGLVNIGGIGGSVTVAADSQTITAVSVASVPSGATVTITTANPLPGLTIGQSLTISGLSNGAYNGTVTVSGVSGDSFTYGVGAYDGTSTLGASAAATVPNVFNVSFGGALSGQDVQTLSVTTVPPFTGSITTATVQSGSQAIANVPTEWFPVGPNPTTNGQTAGSQPVSGSVTSLAVDPRDSTVLYAGTAGGGLWKSIDDGVSWQPIFDALPQVQTLSFAAGSTGTFDLSFEGPNSAGNPVTEVTTVGFDLSSSTLASQIQAALDSLSNIGGVGGQVTVTESTVNGQTTLMITFNGALAGLPINPLNVVYDGSATEGSLASSLVQAGAGVNVNGSTTSGYQTIVMSNGVAGTFKLSYTNASGVTDTTDDLFTDSPTLASDIQNALNSLPNIQGVAGSVQVISSVTNGVTTFTIEFEGSLAEASTKTIQVIPDLTAGTITSTNIAATAGIYIGAVTVDPDNSNIIYVGTGVLENGTGELNGQQVSDVSTDGYQGTGVYESTDGGLTWSLLLDNTSSSGVTNSVTGTDLVNPFYGMAVSAIAVDPATGFDANPTIYVSDGTVDGNGLGVPNGGIGDDAGVTQGIIQPGGTGQLAGVWRFSADAGGQTSLGTWFDLADYTTGARATLKGQQAYPPDWPGPDDDFRINFPEASGTTASSQVWWTDVTVVDTGTSNDGGEVGNPGPSVPVVYAALGSPGENGGDPPRATDPYFNSYGTYGGTNAVYRAYDPDTDSPTWYIGDPGKSQDQIEDIEFQDFLDENAIYSLEFDNVTSLVENYNPNEGATGSNLAALQSAMDYILGKLGDGGAVSVGLVGVSGFQQTFSFTFGGVLQDSPQPEITVANPSAAIDNPAPIVTIPQAGGGVDTESATEFPTNLVDGVDNGTIKLGAYNPPGNIGVDGIVVYASVANSSNGNSLNVEETVDGGLAWSQITTPFDYMNGQGDYANAIYVVNAGTFYIAGAAPNFQDPSGMIYEYTNGAFSADLTVDSSGNSPHDDVHALALGGPNGDSPIVGTDGGVWQLNTTTTAGTTTTTWADLNTTLDTAQVNGVSAAQTNSQDIVAGTEDNGIEVFQGLSAWEETAGNASGTPGMGPSGGDIYIDPQNSEIVYAVLDNPAPGSTTSNFLESTDGGQTWFAVSGMPTNGSAEYPYFPFLIDPLSAGGDRLLIGGPELEQSLDGGVTWQPLNQSNVTAIAVAGYQGVFAADPRFPDVTDIGANQDDSNTIYVAEGSVLKVTKDLGLSWQNCNLPVSAGSVVQSITVNPANRDNVFAVTQQTDNGSAQGLNQVWESTDGGQTWSLIGGEGSPIPGLGNTILWQLAVDPRTGSLYIGTDDGVFALADAAPLTANGPAAVPTTGMWTRFGTGMPDVSVHVLQLNQTTNTLLAGTYGRGVYQLFLDGPESTPTPVSAAASELSGSSVWTGSVLLAGDYLTNTVTIAADGTQGIPDGITAATVNFLGTVSDINSDSDPTLAKSGDGDVILSGDNVYGGTTIVSQGNLVSDNESALGLTTASTIVEAGASLGLLASLDAKPVILNGNGISFDGHYLGALRNISSDNTFSGNISLNPSLSTVNSVTIDADSGSQLTLTGVISGGDTGFTLVKEGTGTITFDANNTYTGTTAIYQGALQAGVNGAFGNTATNLVEVLDGAQVQLLAGVAIGNPLEISGTGINGTGAILGVSGESEWSGAITLEITPGFAPFTLTPGTVAVGADVGDILTLAGEIEQESDPSPGVTADGAGVPTEPFSVPIGLVIVDPGTVVLDNTTANTYSGETVVEQGYLDVQSSNSPLGTRTTPSGTDLTINSSDDFFVTPDGYTPQPSDVGKTLQITYGPGWTVGSYLIVGVSGGEWQLNAAPAAADIANGASWRLDPNTVEQIITLDNAAADASGKHEFTLSFDGQPTTAKLTFGASARAVQNALQGVGGVGGLFASAGQVEVYRSEITTTSENGPNPAVPAIGYVYTLVFEGGLSDTSEQVLASGSNGIVASTSVVGDNGDDVAVDSSLLGVGEVELGNPSSPSTPLTIKNYELALNGTGQSATITIAPGSSGGFVLSYAGRNSAGVQVTDSTPSSGAGELNASTVTASQIQTALDNLANIEGVGGSVTVAATSQAGVFTVVFGGSLAGNDLQGLSASQPATGSVAIQAVEGALYNLAGDNTWDGPVVLDTNSDVGAAPLSATITNSSLTLPNVQSLANTFAGSSPTPPTLDVVGAGTVIFPKGAQYTYEVEFSPTDIESGLGTAFVLTGANLQVDGVTPAGIAPYTGESEIELHGGTLSGNGSVTSIADASSKTGGTIDPGDNYPKEASGLFTIAGNLALTANDTVYANIGVPWFGLQNFGNNNDVLAVDGSIDLNDATLNGLVDTSVALGNPYTVLTTTGAVDGTFVNDDPAGLIPASQTVEYSAPYNQTNVLYGTVSYIDGVRFEVDYFSNRVDVIRTLTPLASATLTTSNGSQTSYGQDEQFVATLTAEAGSPPPTGKVVFAVSGPSGTTNYSVALTPGTTSSTATLDLPSAEGGPMAVGDYTVSITYSGIDANGNQTYEPVNELPPLPAPQQDASVPPATDDVVAANTTNKTTVAYSAPEVYGEPYTFTTSVTTAVTQPVSGTQPPLGSIAYYLGNPSSGGTLWTTVPLSAVTTMQTLSVPTTATGEYTLTFQGETTGEISTTATAAQIAAALNALSSVSGVGGNVSVSSPLSGVFTVVFGGTLAGSSITEATESGNTVEITTQGSINLAPGDVVSVSGLSAGYDGTFEVTAVTGNSFEYTDATTGLSTVTNPLGATSVQNLQTMTVNNASVSNGPVTVALATSQAVLSSDALLPTILGVGAYQIYAVYEPSTNPQNYNSSFSTASLPVNKDNSTVTVSLAPGTPTPLYYGESGVTLDIAINPAAPGGGAPTGTVNIQDGSLVMAFGVPVVPNADGDGSTVTFTIPSGDLQLGSSAISVQYSGDNNFNASSGQLSPPLSVLAAKTQIASLTSSSPLVSGVPTSGYGTPVTFTAVVAVEAPGAGTPTGTVYFYVNGGATPIGSGTLSSTSGVDSATYTTTNFQLPEGTDTITATYVPSNGDFQGATSPPSLTQDVTATLAGTTVTSNSPVIGGVPTSVYGQSVTFTATVTPPTGAASAPTGTVSFYLGSTSNPPLNSSPITLTSSAGVYSASYTASATQLTVGSDQTIIAVFTSNNPNYDNSQGTMLQTVAKANTATSLAANGPVTPGQSTVTFTATVAASAPGSGNPTGLVYIYANGGATPIGSGTVNTSTGVAQITVNTSQLLPGVNAITATYGGDNNFNSSSATGSQAVEDGTSTTVSYLPNSPTPVYGQGVTLTATITPDLTAASNPTGTVTFYLGSTNIGVANVGSVGSLTTASITVYNLPVSTTGNSITADYSGDGTFTGSDSSATLVPIGKDQTSTSLSASSLSSTPTIVEKGQAVILTAQVAPVAPGGSTPTGTVTFKDGSTTLGTATVNAATGTATLQTSLSTLGNNNITATYNGDADDLTSSSSTSVTVDAVGSRTSKVTVASSQNPSVFGNPVTLTATVTDTGSGSTQTPTGTVSFFANGVLIGNVALTGSGKTATAAFTTSNLPVGSDAITAQFNGSSVFAHETSATLTQVVNPGSTQITVQTSGSPAGYASPVTYTATVATGGSATPTGTVTFKAVPTSGGSTITLGTGTLSGSNGVATASLTNSTLLPGSYTITATYSGEMGSVAQTIDAGTTSTLLTSSMPNGSTYGQAVTFKATVTVPGSTVVPTGTVSFYINGSPTPAATVTLSKGVASYKPAAGVLIAPGDEVEAVYNGNADLGSSNDSISQTVNQDAANLVLTSSSTINAAVTLTCTVTAASPGSGKPTGTVDFYIDGNYVGTANVVNGKATLTETTYEVTTSGNHTVEAEYSGDNNFDGESVVKTVNFTVGRSN